jgi:hypothetical protein
VSSQWYYRPGDYYQIDDISGFKIRASRSKRIPGGQTGGLVVAPERYEEQQPQDFVRGVIDIQTVEVPRPRQPNQFVIVGTYVTSFAPRLTNWISVDDSREFRVLDRIMVMLNNSDPFHATITSIVRNQLQITPSLPHAVGDSIGNPLENTVLNMGPSPYPVLLTGDTGIPITNDSGDWISTDQ